MSKAFEVVTEIPVRYAETDKMGIVYHANYLIYGEVARTHYLEALGFPYSEMEEAGYLSPVIDINLKYGLPCTFGDTVKVVTSVTKLTPVRTEYSYKIFLKDDDPETAKPRVTGSSTHCLVTADTFKAVNQKKAFPKLYEAYQQAMGDGE